MLSNRRANSEMAGWLEQHEKQSELLGGAGDVLANSQSDPYLSQAVLDLQFGHSQRVGYDVATNVLSQLQRIGDLHKRRPEHASLGVLRSPDIPSIWWKRGLSVITAKSGCWGAMLINSRSQRPFITVCVTTLCNILYNPRRAGQPRRLPAQVRQMGRC